MFIFLGDEFMVCQKCNGTKFDDWSAKGAKFKTCLNCYQVYQLTQSDELDEYQKEAKRKRENRGSQPQIICPYCNSDNCKKIGVLGRSASIGFWGLASGKVGKQWHCNNCKSDF